MTKPRNLVLLAVALVAIALVATNGTFVRSLFGQRATLSVGGQQTQGGAMTQPGGTTSGGQTLPSSGPAAAAAKATTSVAVTPDARDRGYMIEARLVTKEGKPVANAVVRFYDVVQLLGPREMLIGQEATDGFGVVSLTYKPAQGGTHQIVARPANVQLAATDGRTTFDATVVAPATYARERLPLDRFSVNLPMAGAALLLVIWGSFAFVLFGSFIRIPRGTRQETPHLSKAREFIGRNV